MIKAIVVLVAILVLLEGARILQVRFIDRDSRRRIDAMPPPVTVSEVIEGARAIATTAEREDPLQKLLAQRYVGTLREEGGSFGGVMTDARVVCAPSGEVLIVYTFEQVSTMPKGDGDTPEEAAGRLIIDSSGIAYLQQIG